MQLSLLDFDEPAPRFRPDVLDGDGDGDVGSPRTYSLFFGIQVDAAAFDNPVNELLREHGLDRPKTAIPRDRWHISLQDVAEFTDTLDQKVLDAALAAAARTTCAPLHLTFDHALSFQGSHAFVLRCDPASDAAIARLRQPLKAELTRHGIPSRSSSTPHLTIAYGRDRLIPHQAIPHIRWTATRFALILSHVGRGHHQRIEEWVLAG